MVITDRYDHVIDDKGRLAIPSQVRAAMDPQEDGESFYLVPEGRYLQLIPQKLFERLAANATAALAMSYDAAKVRRLYFGNTSRLDPDKQGRVIIPERFLVQGQALEAPSHCVLGRKVSLVGAGDRLELWNRGALDAHMSELNHERVVLQDAIEKMFLAPAPPTSVPGSAGSPGTRES